jgi:hypothetical protein
MATTAWRMPGGPVPWIAAFAVFGLVLFHPGVFHDGDTYWHVATGEWILAHRAIPKVDPFLATGQARPWVCHEWLADAVLAAAYRAGGWGGTALVAGAAAALAIFLSGIYLSRRFTPLGTAVLLTVAVTIAAPSLLIRPHLLALPMLVGWMIALLAARDRSAAPPWPLLALMVVWANSHGSYVLGLALTGVFALEAVAADAGRRRQSLLRWGGFSVAAVASSLITPFGLSGLLHPFHLMRMEALPMLVEWRPLDLATFQPLEVLLLAGAYLGLSRGIRLPPVRLLILIGSVHLALVHARHGILVPFVGMMAIADPLARQLGMPRTGDGFRPLWAVLPMIGVLCLAAIRLEVPVSMADTPSTPSSALAHVPAGLAQQPVYNDYGFGGYLLFSKIAPMIDGRTDMYGDVFVQEYEAASRFGTGQLPVLLTRYRVQWSLLRTGSQPAAMMDELTGWCRLYADRLAVVHARASSEYCPGH